VSREGSVCASGLEKTSALRRLDSLTAQGSYLVVGRVRMSIA
jgi:hypothetical protein